MNYSATYEGYQEEIEGYHLVIKGSGHKYVAYSKIDVFLSAKLLELEDQRSLRLSNSFFRMHFPFIHADTSFNVAPYQLFILLANHLDIYKNFAAEGIEFVLKDIESIEKKIGISLPDDIKLPPKPPKERHLVQTVGEFLDLCIMIKPYAKEYEVGLEVLFNLYKEKNRKCN